MNRAERAGILVPEHFVPTPTTVSPQVQAFLSKPPASEPASMPEATDIGGWWAYIEKANAALTTFLAKDAKRFPANTLTHTLASVQLYEVVPHNALAEHQTRAVLYIHGGGFVLGRGEAAMYAAFKVASLIRMRTFSIDYRMPPDHPFPAGLNDVVEAYRWLLSRYAPENIALYGTSAGGSLVAACVLKAHDAGLPTPAVCVIHAPVADLTESGDTFRTNAMLDVVLRHGLASMPKLYAGEYDLRNPLVSPIFGDYTKGFPPTILTSGTRDLLLSATVLLHRALRRAGVKAELHIWEAVPHVISFDAPEASELMDEQIKFMLAHLAGDNRQ
jgi:acetyl esterase/lipase